MLGYASHHSLSACKTSRHFSSDLTTNTSIKVVRYHKQQGKRTCSLKLKLSLFPRVHLQQHNYGSR